MLLKSSTSANPSRGLKKKLPKRRPGRGHWSWAHQRAKPHELPGLAQNDPTKEKGATVVRAVAPLSNHYPHSKETARMIVHASEKLRIHPDPKLPPGTNYCLCPSCGHYFGGVTAFDMHLGPASDRACLAPGGMSDSHKQPLLRLSNRGYWVRIRQPIHLQQPPVPVAA